MCVIRCCIVHGMASYGAWHGIVQCMLTTVICMFIAFLVLLAGSVGVMRSMMVDGRQHAIPCHATSWHAMMMVDATIPQSHHAHHAPLAPHVCRFPPLDALFKRSDCLEMIRPCTMHHAPCTNASRWSGPYYTTYYTVTHTMPPTILHTVPIL